MPADKLGAGAVSVKEFTEALEGFADTGGFAEGAMLRLSQTTTGKFSTAMDNAKMAAADLGKSLLPIISDILDGVVEAAQGFIKMDDGVKALSWLWFAVAGIWPSACFPTSNHYPGTGIECCCSQQPHSACYRNWCGLEGHEDIADNATKSIEELRVFDQLTAESREQKRQEAADSLICFLHTKTCKNAN